jgi:hypothetical protein
MELAIAPNKLKPCEDWPSAVSTHTLLTYLTYGFADEDWTRSCPLTCQQRSYTYTMKPYHINSVVDPTNKYFTKLSQPVTYIGFSYETLLTEEKEETLVYDVTNFLVNAGGNLGLFLGFSCLSILLYAIKLCKSKFA